jgi:hypothetical protein
MTDEKPTSKPAEKPAEKPAPKAEDVEVDPRLDNRTGDQRPVLAEELKPQQIDGGPVGDTSEVEVPPTKNDQGGKVLGAHSEGPHGRGPEA